MSKIPIPKPLDLRQIIQPGSVQIQEADLAELKALDTGQGYLNIVESGEYTDGLKVVINAARESLSDAINKAASEEGMEFLEDIDLRRFSLCEGAGFLQVILELDNAMSEHYKTRQLIKAFKRIALEVRQKVHEMSDKVGSLKMELCQIADQKDQLREFIKNELKIKSPDTLSPAEVQKLLRGNPKHAEEIRAWGKLIGLEDQIAKTEKKEANAKKLSKKLEYLLGEDGTMDEVLSLLKVNGVINRKEAVDIKKAFNEKYENFFITIPIEVLRPETIEKLQVAAQDEGRIGSGSRGSGWGLRVAAAAVLGLAGVAAWSYFAEDDPVDQSPYSETSGSSDRPDPGASDGRFDFNQAMSDIKNLDQDDIEQLKDFMRPEVKRLAEQILSQQSFEELFLVGQEVSIPFPELQKEYRVQTWNMKIVRSGSGIVMTWDARLKIAEGIDIKFDVRVKKESLSEYERMMCDQWMEDEKDPELTHFSNFLKGDLSPAYEMADEVPDGVTEIGFRKTNGQNMSGPFAIVKFQLGAGGRQYKMGRGFTWRSNRKLVIKVPGQDDIPLNIANDFDWKTPKTTRIAIPGTLLEKGVRIHQKFHIEIEGVDQPQTIDIEFPG